MKLNLKIVSSILLGCALALFVPPIRAIVLFLLPLGSGFDDLLFVLLAILGVALKFGDYGIKETNVLKSKKIIFATIVVAVVVAILVISSML